MIIIIIIIIIIIEPNKKEEMSSWVLHIIFNGVLSRFALDLCRTKKKVPATKWI